jgi:hypothetical protein
MKFRFPVRLLAAAVAGWLASCILEKDPGTGEGPSTETGNPNLSGALVDAQGHAVPGAVKLFRLPVAPAGGEDTTAALPPILVRIDTVAVGGGYRFDSLPPATYALEGADAAARNFSLVRGLAVASAKDTLLRNLAVQAPARIRGRVTRGPDSRPAGVSANEKIWVRLGGADRSAVTDTAGDFTLENVPAGLYRMAFAAADGHYLTRYLDSVAAVPGGDLVLPQVNLEWSRFVAPPAIAGLSATRDSAANVVRLRWRAVRLSGGAEVRYQVVRVDSLYGDAKTFIGTDTAWSDSLGDLPRGTRLGYTVRALNPLGQPGPSDSLPAVPAPGWDTAATGTGLLQGVVVSKGFPLPGAMVRLYAVPAAPGSPDSLPLDVRRRDSALTGADGRYRFAALPAGRYTVAAQRPASAEMAISMGLAPRAEGARLDTLEPFATGTVEGAASRDSLWISSPFKGDENIRASLAGAPFSALTGYGTPPAGGAFSLKGVPAGIYKLVVYAIPEGYFLADTLDVSMAPGADVRLPAVIKARYNPSAPPPKIAGLRLDALTRSRVSLAWTPVARYAPLQGYRVLRLGADLAVLDSSAVLTAAGYADDISRVPVGTRLNYAVRVVSVSGREGENGGDASGLPVAIMVPAGP